MVKVEHEEPRRAHKLGTARPLWLGALLLAPDEVLAVFITIEHAHIGDGGHLALCFYVASAVTENVLLGLLGIDDDAESLCIARLQYLVKCVVYVVNHFEIYDLCLRIMNCDFFACLADLFFLVN